MNRVEAKVDHIGAEQVLVALVIKKLNLSPVLLKEVKEVEIDCWHQFGGVQQRVPGDGNSKHLHVTNLLPNLDSLPKCLVLKPVKKYPIEQHRQDHCPCQNISRYLSAKFNDGDEPVFTVDLRRQFYFVLEEQQLVAIEAFYRHYVRLERRNALGALEVKLKLDKLVARLLQLVLEFNCLLVKAVHSLVHS